MGRTIILYWNCIAESKFLIVYSESETRIKFLEQVMRQCSVCNKN